MKFINVITANGVPVASAFSDARATEVLAERQAFYDALQENSTGKRPTCYSERKVNCSHFSVTIADHDPNPQ